MVYFSFSTGLGEKSQILFIGRFYVPGPCPCGRFSSAQLSSALRGQRRGCPPGRGRGRSSANSVSRWAGVTRSRVCLRGAALHRWCPRGLVPPALRDRRLPESAKGGRVSKTRPQGHLSTHSTAGSFSALRTLIRYLLRGLPCPQAQLVFFN